MGYNRKNNGIGIAIVLVILAVGLLATTGWIGVKNGKQKEVLKDIQVKAETLEASKSTLSTQVDAIKEKNDQLVNQVEELTQEIDKLKAQGVDVDSSANESEENKKYAYLTFDDGPSQNTVKILDFLKVNNIQATFFVTKKEGYDDVYKRIVDEGHTLALHTATHDYTKLYKSVDAYFEDLNSVSDHAEEITGVKSKIIRFPGGSTNTVSNTHGGKGLMDKIIAEVEKQGYVYYDWNVDSNDANKAKQDKNVIVDSVLSQAKWVQEANILMHDAAGKVTTVEALPEIVEGLKEQGFLFRPITDETTPVQFK